MVSEEVSGWLRLQHTQAFPARTPVSVCAVGIEVVGHGYKDKGDDRHGRGRMRRNRSLQAVSCPVSQPVSVFFDISRASSSQHSPDPLVSHSSSCSSKARMLPSPKLILAVAALAGSTLAAPLQNRQVTCYSGVYMIVARGSNEDAGEGTTSQVADLVAAAIPGSGRVAVDYPATITGPLYPESVTQGINDAKAKIQAYISACPGGKIALLGRVLPGG